MEHDGRAGDPDGLGTGPTRASFDWSTSPRKSPDSSGLERRNGPTVLMSVYSWNLNL